MEYRGQKDRSIGQMFREVQITDESYTHGRQVHAGARTHRCMHFS